MAGALALPKLREPLGVPRAAALPGLALGVPGAAVALPRGRVRDYGVFLAQMWAYLRAFELTYAEPERLRSRLRVDFPIAADRVLGGGRPPTVRLQAWRRRSRPRRAVDRALGVVYLGWAVERHAVLLWALARHPRAFARSAALVAAGFDVGWVLYTALPTAPPWWAAKHGRLPGVHRVTVDVTRDLPLVPEQSEEDEDQANPWASFPSTHVLSAAMVAVAAGELDASVGAAAWAYVATLGLALVYLGEHYALDVLAGLGVAAAITSAEPLARGPARRVARALNAASDAAWPGPRRPWPSSRRRRLLQRLT